MAKTTVVGTRVEQTMLEQLDAEAARRGITRADLLGEYVVEGLAKRYELKRLRGLADTLAEQARTLFAHLPEGEIIDGEPLHFTATGAGTLVVHADRTQHEYQVFENAAVRMRLLGDQAELTFWRDGNQIDQKLVDLQEDTQ